MAQWYGCDRCGQKMREADGDYVSFSFGGTAAEAMGLGMKDASLRARTLELCRSCAERFNTWVVEGADRL